MRSIARLLWKAITYSGLDALFAVIIVNLLFSFRRIAVPLLQKHLKQFYLEKAYGFLLTAYDLNKLRIRHDIDFMFKLDTLTQRIARTEFVRQREARPLQTRRLRIGFMGPFSGLLGFPRELFEQFPQQASLFLYDFVYRQQSVENYGDFCTYRRVALPAQFEAKPEELRSTARVVNDDNLDAVFLISIGWMGRLLLDHIRTPNLIYISCGALDLLYHEKCSLQANIAQPAPYSVRNGRLYSKERICVARIGLLQTNVFHYDKRGIEPLVIDKNLLAKKERKIVYLGNSYKLDSKEYRECVTRLLKENADLTLVCYTKPRERKSPQARVREYFEKAGVSQQVVFNKGFSALRESDGSIVAPNRWKKALHELESARLFMDTFPWGGGSSVVEAYLSGVPVIFMSKDEESWSRKPLLNRTHSELRETTLGRAKSLDEYCEKCQRVLDDDAFATEIIREQYDLARTVLCNEEYFWQEIIRMVHRSNELNVENQGVA